MRIIGKIIRAGKCPIDKTTPCSECDHYDGWGVDMIQHKLYIWCYPKKVFDGAKMKMVIPAI